MSEVSQNKPRLWARIGIVRLLLFFVILAAVDAGCQVGLQFGRKTLPADVRNWALIAGVVLAAALMLVVYRLLVRWLEHRKVQELALLRGIPLTLAGIVAAFVVFCAMYGIFWAVGAAPAPAFVGYGHVMPFVVMAILSGVGEELIFRGCIYRLFEDSFGSLVALIVSGALFGGLHIFNPHATIVSSAAIALEAGIMLGAAYAATRSLWLPIGIHMGWNFTEGGVFGAAVSGGGGGHGIVSMPLTGPDLLTGGAFGPEASLVSVALWLAISVGLIAWTLKRGRWVPLSFHLVLG